METLTLRCSAPKCPRTRKTPRTEYDPPRAVVAVLACPWHHQEGDTETYFDAKGREVVPR